MGRSLINTPFLTLLKVLNKIPKEYFSLTVYPEIKFEQKTVQEYRKSN